MGFARIIRLGFFTLTALSLVISAIAVMSLKWVTTSKDEVSQTYTEDLRRADALEASFERSVAANRGYLLTGDPSYVELQKAAEATFDADLSFLRNQSLSVEAREHARLLYRTLGDWPRRYTESQAARIEVSGGVQRLRESLEFALAKKRRASAEIARRSKVLLVFAGCVALLIAGGLFFAVNRVLAKHRHAEDNLRDSEARFRLLVNGVKDHAIFMLDPLGKIMSWNSGAERLSGYSAHEVIGLDCSIFFRNEDIAEGKLEELRNLAVLQGSCEFEQWRVRKDGSQFWANILMTALRDEAGNLTGFSAVTRDVSEHRRIVVAQEFLADASEILARSLDFRRTLSEVAKLVVPRVADYCVIYIVDERDRMNQVELSCSDPLKEVMVRKMLEKYPPHRNADGSALSVLRSGQAQLLKEIDDSWYRSSAISPDHEQYLRAMELKSLMTVPILAGGRVRGAISLGASHGSAQYGLSDLSLASELGRRAGYAIENARLYQEARDAISVRDEFLSIASHELKTPLTSMYLQVQLLGRGLAPDVARQMIENCRIQAKRLGKLIDDLLDLTRVRSGKLDIRLEQVNLSQVVREVVGRHSPDALQAGSDLVMDLPENIHGEWDRMRLDQIVSNLLSNAIKYGEGKAIHIRAGVDSERDVATVWVRDHGPGISPENQSRIFERFERAITSKHISGLGLGLYIVRRVLDALGGRIHVKSALGAGSEFSVEIPVRPVLPISLTQAKTSHQHEIAVH